MYGMTNILINGAFITIEGALPRYFPFINSIGINGL